MEDIISVLSASPLIRGYILLKFERTQFTRRLKIAVELTDGSQLTISEATSPRGFRYAYHWQKADGSLIARWDNAPHHPSLSTFPDHLHAGSKIEASTQPTIRDVLDYISDHLKS